MWIDIGGHPNDSWTTKKKRKKVHSCHHCQNRSSAGQPHHQPICICMHLNKGAMESPSSQASKQAVQCGIAAGFSRCHLATSGKRRRVCPPRGSLCEPAEIGNAEGTGRAGPRRQRVVTSPHAWTTTSTSTESSLANSSTTLLSMRICLAL